MTSLPALPSNAVAALMNSQAASRGYDLRSQPNAQALGPDEFRWARAALDAALRSLATEPESVRREFARFLHPESYKALEAVGNAFIGRYNDLTDEQNKALIEVADAVLRDKVT